MKEVGLGLGLDMAQVSWLLVYCPRVLAGFVKVNIFGSKKIDRHS